MKIIFIILLSLCLVSYLKAQEYGIAISSTPVLNTPDYNSVFGGGSNGGVKLDSKGLIREMEFVALPGTVFEIVASIPAGGHFMYQIKTEDYPYDSTPLYIDSRFVRTSDTKPESRKQIMPSKDEIINNLKALEGYPYMWGGNYAPGIQEMLSYYSPASELDNRSKELWTLKGVDCSGLIYQSTGGSTPRNTSSLIKYGTGLEIEGKSASEIASQLQPLDLIVWSGHVVIVLDSATTIESTPAEGVHRSDLLSRLQSIMSERKAVNEWSTGSSKRFVIRRFIQ